MEAKGASVIAIKYSERCKNYEERKQQLNEIGKNRNYESESRQEAL